MSSYDAAEIVFPSGSTFVLDTALSVDEGFTPRWLFDGGSNAAALSGYVPGVGDEQNSEQAFIGTGAKIRQFTVTGAVKSEGMTQWGSTDDTDDVIVKLNELGHELATARVDSTNPCELSWGEYSSAGAHSPIKVVPGEIQLPGNVSEEPSSVTITTNWLSSVDLQAAIHQADPTN